MKKDGKSRILNESTLILQATFDDMIIKNMVHFKLIV